MTNFSVEVSSSSYDSQISAPVNDAHTRKNISQLCDIINKCALNLQSKIHVILPPIVPKRIYDHTVAKGRGYLNYTPAGIMYVAASIRDERIPGFSDHIRLFDLNNLVLQNSISPDDPGFDSWKEHIQSNIRPKSKPIFIVSCMFATTKENFYDVVEFLRSEYPSCLIISGGVQATFDADSILYNQGSSIVSMYEGESSLPELFRFIYDYLTGNSLSKTPGSLKFLNDREQVVSTTIAQRSDQLELDINEYYDQLNIGQYYRAGTIGGGYANFLFHKTGIDRPWVNVLTKRGCRAACAFCTVRNFNGKGFRLRSRDRLKSELDKLYHDHRVRHIDWLDDDFLYDKEHTKMFLNLIIDNYPDLVWTASNGLIGTAIDDELMDLMVRSGMAAFSIGIESGNSEVVKDIRKPTTLMGLIRRKPIFNKYPEVLFMANFIIGFPGETFGQMLDTYIFTRKLECDWSKYFICQPLKGTDLFNNFQSIGDERTKDESWEKNGPNPGRMVAQSGGLNSAYNEFRACWSIFNLDPSLTFSKDQHNEIWFTFNLVTNFLQNPCYNNKVATEKLSYFLKALRKPYPNDVSMAAALAHCHYLLNEYEEFRDMQIKMLQLLSASPYWIQRVISFPELLTLAHIIPAELPPELQLIGVS